MPQLDRSVSGLCVSQRPASRNSRHRNPRQANGRPFRAPDPGSRSGDARLEEVYATHFLWPDKGAFRSLAPKGPVK
jgi:hypothetical protein